MSSSAPADDEALFTPRFFALFAFAAAAMFVAVARRYKMVDNYRAA